MSEGRKWNVARVIATTFDKDTNEVGKSIFAGWSNGLFALDFRSIVLNQEWVPVWALTHLPSGYAIGLLICQHLEDAMSFAKWAESLGDWQFKEHAEASRRFPDFVELAAVSGWDLAHTYGQSTIKTWLEVGAEAVQ